MKSTLLLIDDEEAVLNALAEALGDLGHDLLTSTDSAEALEIVKAKSPALVITDLKMPGMDGMTLLQRIQEFNPGIQVIMVTGHGSIEDAVAAMKKGAYDFISKPFSVAEIEATVQRALEKARLLQENLALRDKLRKASIPSFSEGKSPVFRELLEASRLAADSDATILVLGESGTGKEILAHYIAAYSQRASQPFVAINCAAIPENLIETELFGHKRGAFTGAYQDKKGKFQEAQGGTIFLDEIGDLPLNVQSKLLRVLQEGEATPVGGTAQKVNVRVIAATNKPLRKMAAEGLFREDLFYRLNVVALRVPALRERMEDLPTYLAFFIAKYCLKNRRETLSVAPEALKILEQYTWPGNLRELENVTERAVILSRGSEITAKALPAELSEEGATLSPFNFKRGMKLRQVEHLVIQDTLRYNNGDRGKSARDLGIGQRTLYRKLLEIQAEIRATDVSATIVSP
jgi:DNA-binding NtrC family response regulator